MTAASLKFLPSMALVRNSLAILPLAILAYDTLFSLCRIRGSSMEPTLYDGDVVVVRKSDGLWQRWTRHWPEHNQDRSDGNDNKNHATRNTRQKCSDDDDDDIDANKTTTRSKSQNDSDDDDKYRWAIERGQVLEFEQHYCRSSPNTGWLRTPPVPVTGSIVVFQDPETYPSKWNIKRVIGLGGQTVLASRRTQSSKSSSSATDKQPQTRRKRWSLDEYMTGMKVLTTHVPAYSIWVEGDNISNSRDSRHSDHGPVSKKLLVGVAEYRVWPPWRIGKLDNTHEALLEKEDGGDDDENSEKSTLPRQPKYRARSYWP